MNAQKTQTEFLQEIDDLRGRLEEAEDTLRAIRSGEVDALLVTGPQGQQVFTLRGSDYTYRMLVEQMSEGAATLDAQGAVLYCNRSLADLLQLPMKNLTGASLLAHTDDAGAAVLQRLLSHAAGAPKREEITLRTANGNPIPVLVALNPLVIEGLNLFCITVTDIRQRKEAEAALRNSLDSLNAQHRAAINIAQDELTARKRAERAEHDLIKLNAELEQRVEERTAEVERHAALIEAVSDAQSRFISAENSRESFDSCLNDFLRMTGSAYGFIDELSYTADGKPYLTSRAITNIAWNDETRALYPKFLTGELRFDNLNSLYGAVMTTGAPVIANDAPNDSRRCGIPPGHPALNAFLGLPMHAGPEFVGIIGLANAPAGYSEHTVAYLAPMVKACANIISAERNEQRKRQDEEELQKLNARLRKGTVALEAANQELEAFAYSVSHDLRAPIRHIAGFGDLLSRKCGKQLDEAGSRYLSQIQDSAQKMAELIDDLLEFSRVGRAEVRFRAIALDQLVRAAQEELGPDLSGRDICWNIQALPEVQGDSTLLTRVLVNLLSNAVKYTRHKTPAAIEVGHIGSEDEDVIFVRDNGCGFDMKYANKLFGVFQRLHSAEEFEGTGIGLASVRRIIHLHGGRTWGEGAVDGGATFYFSLPKTGKEAGNGQTEKDSPR